MSYDKKTSSALGKKNPRLFVSFLLGNVHYDDGGDNDIKQRGLYSSKMAL